MYLFWSGHKSAWIICDTFWLQSRRSQPIEDSQDLYGGSESDHNNSFTSSAMHNSFGDDAVSQMLDADG